MASRQAGPGGREFSHETQIPLVRRGTLVPVGGDAIPRGGNRKRGQLRKSGKITSPNISLLSINGFLHSKELDNRRVGLDVRNVSHVRRPAVLPAKTRLVFVAEKKEKKRA